MTTTAASAATKQWLREHQQYSQKVRTLQLSLQVPALLQKYCTVEEQQQIAVDSQQTVNDCQQHRKYMEQQSAAVTQRVNQFISVVQSIKQGGSTGSNSTRRGSVDNVTNSIEDRLQRITELSTWIEDTLFQLKTQHKDTYHQLTVQEKQLQGEIDGMNAKVETWLDGETGSNAFGGKTQTLNGTVAGFQVEDSASTSVSTTIKQQIEAIQRDVDQAGGSTGGWHADDHAHYLKLHKQHLSHSSMIERLCNELPEMTAANVMQHMQWYEQYQQWLQQRKQLIAEWRQQSQLQALTGADEFTIADDPAEAAAASETAAAAEKKAARRKAVLEAERRERAAAVAEWKASKAAAEEESAERNAAEQRTREEQQIRRAEAERVRLKQQLDAYKSKQQEESKQQANEPVTTQLTAEERRQQQQRLRERSDEHFQRSLTMKSAKQNAAAEREQRLAAMAAQAQQKVVQIDDSVLRDKSRLTRPTSVMQQRLDIMKKEQEQQADSQGRPQTGRRPSTAGLSINSAPVRAIPTWRQGI